MDERTKVKQDTEQEGTALGSQPAASSADRAVDPVVEHITAPREPDISLWEYLKQRKPYIRRYIFEVLDSERVDNGFERALNYFLLILIVLNTVAVIAEPSFPTGPMAKFLRVFQVFSVLVFTVEYGLRVWVSDLYRPKLRPGLARLRYMVSGMALIDLMAILPFYLPFVFAVDLRVLRTLRLFRLFRIFKKNRYIKSLHLVMDVFKRKSSELSSSLSIVAILLLISSVLMYSFEHPVQPQYFRNILDALWWSIATVTTIGYGDIYPVTDIGRGIASFVAFLGVGIIAIPTGIIASGFTEIVQENRIRENLEETRRLILSCAQPQQTASDSDPYAPKPSLLMRGEEGYEEALHSHPDGTPDLGPQGGASGHAVLSGRGGHGSSHGSAHGSSHGSRGKHHCPHCGHELD